MNNWLFKPELEQPLINNLCESLNVSEVIAKLLLYRDIHNFDEAKHFFRPSLEHLHDPYLMKGMDKAVTRISEAITSQSRIMIYGDYDVDGTTSVTLLYTFLREHTSNIEYYIPDRYKEGYGISTQGIDTAIENKVSLIIALDCGIKSVDKVAYANSKGVDFIICDHHQPAEELPDAVAILNAKQQDCNYPYKELCGCGVGFKLIQGLSIHWKKNQEHLIPYLDLVAIAIAADIVPITGENRVLAHLGMQQLQHHPRSVFQQFLPANQDIKISDVVFKLAPHINAAGRIAHAHDAVSILLEQDHDKLLSQSQYIKGLNDNRRKIEQQITAEALHQLTDTNSYTSVVYSEHWHKGVVGIVASRLIETYYRPTVVLTLSGDTVVGSARSVSGYDLYAAIEACSEHLIQFGGHTFAAGMTMHKEQLDNFKKSFEDYVSKTITPSSRSPHIKIDTSINFSDITPKFMRILKQFAPFGPKNMNPVFCAENLQCSDTPSLVGKDKEHLKFEVIQKGENAPPIRAIGFGLADKLDILQQQKPFSMLFSIEENIWNQKTYIDLKVKDIKI